MGFPFPIRGKLFYYSSRSVVIKLKIEEIVYSERMVTAKFLFDGRYAFEIQLPVPPENLGSTWKHSQVDQLLGAALARLALKMEDFREAITRHPDSPKGVKLPQMVDALRQERIQDEGRRQETSVPRVVR